MELFHYNWQIRDDWFEWCKKLEEVEWSKERVGGMKSFKATFLHLIDEELTWVNYATGENVIYEKKDSLEELEEVRAYSEFVKIHTAKKLAQLPNNPKQHQVNITTKNGKIINFSLKKFSNT